MTPPRGTEGQFVYCHCHTSNLFVDVGNGNVTTTTTTTAKIVSEHFFAHATSSKAMQMPPAC